MIVWVFTPYLQYSSHVTGVYFLKTRKITNVRFLWLYATTPNHVLLDKTLLRKCTIIEHLAVNRIQTIWISLGSINLTSKSITISPPPSHPHKGINTCTSKKIEHDPPYPPISFLLSFGLCYTCWLNLYKKNIQIFITINVAGIELTF